MNTIAIFTLFALQKTNLVDSSSSKNYRFHSYGHAINLAGFLDAASGLMGGPIINPDGLATEDEQATNAVNAFFDFGGIIEYGLADGLSNFVGLPDVDKIKGCGLPDIKDILADWRLKSAAQIETLLSTNLFCLTRFNEESKEAAELEWIIQDISSAIQTRSTFCE